MLSKKHTNWLTSSMHCPTLQFPLGAVDRDEQELCEFGWDFESLVKYKMKKLRWTECISNSKHLTPRQSRAGQTPFTRDDLTTYYHEMFLLADLSLIPNGDGTWPALSNTFPRAALVVERIIFYASFYQPGLAIVLRQDTVQRYIKGVHLTRVDWTTKVGKRQSCPLNNEVFGTNQPGNQPVNSEYTKTRFWSAIWSSSPPILNFYLYYDSGVLGQCAGALLSNPMERF